MTESRRLALVLGFTQMTAWATTYYVPAVTTVAVAAELGVDIAAVIGGFSLALLVSGLCAPWMGRQIDRRGGRPVLVVGTALQAAGLLLLASSPGLPQWYAGWTVLGLGMSAGLYDAAFATAGRALGIAARPAITGITLLGGFASSLGWPMGAAMVASYGWRVTLATYAGIVLCVNLPLYLAFVPVTPAALPVVEDTDPTPPAGGKMAFLLMAAFFTIRAAISTVVTVSAPALLAGLGLGVTEAVAVAALIGPAQVGSRLLQATVGRRLSPIVTTWIGALLLPVVTVALVGIARLPGAPLYAATLVFVVGYGLSNGILTISRGVLPLYLFGPQGYAARIGQIALPALLAQAAAPTLTAALVSDWPAERMFLALGAVSLLAAGCLIPLRPPLRRPAPP